MPTDGPVTITVDRPTGIGTSRPEPREPREPREYREPGGGGGGGSGDPAEALAALGALFAAPVMLVGGAIYIGGKTVSDWFAEQRRRREDARLQEAERRRLEDEDRRHLEEVTRRLQALAAQGRGPLLDALGDLLDRMASDAAAAELQFPYEGKDWSTHIDDLRFRRQNDFDGTLIKAYKDLWNDPAYRPVLSLISPLDLKAMMAWESWFDPEKESRCAYKKRGCGRMGVGLMSMTVLHATGKDAAGLRVDRSVDERLEPEKAMRGALRSLSIVRSKIVDIYLEKRQVPAPGALRERTILGYNTSYGPMRRSLRAAPEEAKIPLSRLTVEDLLKPTPDGGEPVLARRVNTRANPRKFEKETSKYLPGIRDWLGRAAAKQEKKR